MQPTVKRTNKGGTFMVLLALLIGVLSVLAPVTARADTIADDSSNGSGASFSAVSGTKDPCSVVAQSNSYALPAKRWSGASSTMFVDNDPGLNVVQAAGNSMRTSVGGGAMAVGNTGYLLASDWVQSSTAFCPLRTFGAQIDHMVGTIGSAILNSPIIMISAGVALFGFVAAKLRHGGRGGLADLAKKLLALALLGVIVAGATASSDPGKGEYRPGVMSPGWLMTKTDQVTSVLGGVLVNAWPVSVTYGSDETTRDDPLSCVNYRYAMAKQYRSDAGSGALSGNNATAAMVSKLWEAAAIPTFERTQFGDNRYAEVVSCYYFESNADAVGFTTLNGLSAGTTIQSVLNRASMETGSSTSWSSKKIPGAIFKAAHGDDAGAAMVALGACKLDRNGDPTSAKSWSVRGYSAKNKSALEILPPDNRDPDKAAEACAAVFTAKSSDISKKLDFFRWSGNRSDITNNVTDPDVASFLTTMQGYSASNEVAGMMVYAVGAWASVLVIGGMALGLIVAKLAAVMMGVGLVLSLVMAAFTGTDKTLGYAKSYLGLSLFCAAFVFLLSLIAFVTGIVGELSTTLWPRGGVAKVAVVSLSPLIAWIVLSKIFKKIGMPNPVTLKGGLAYAAAAKNLDGSGLTGGDSEASVSRAGQRSKQAIVRAGAGAARGVNRAKTTLQQGGGLKAAAAAFGGGAVAGALGTKAARGAAGAPAGTGTEPSTAEKRGEKEADAAEQSDTVVTSGRNAATEAKAAGGKRESGPRRATPEASGTAQATSSADLRASLQAVDGLTPEAQGRIDELDRLEKAAAARPRLRRKVVDAAKGATRVAGTGARSVVRRTARTTAVVAGATAAGIAAGPVAALAVGGAAVAHTARKRRNQGREKKAEALRSELARTVQQSAEAKAEKDAAALAEAQAQQTQEDADRRARSKAARTAKRAERKQAEEDAARRQARLDRVRPKVNRSSTVRRPSSAARRSTAVKGH